MTDTDRFSAAETRQGLGHRGILPNNILSYYYRPFDSRWIYWEPETKLLDEKRSEYWADVSADNIWLTATGRNRKEAFYQPQVTQSLADHHVVESNVGMFPLYRNSTPRAENLTPIARSYLVSRERPAISLFHHTLAILHSGHYERENAGGIRLDWPRVPLPLTAESLDTSAALGKTLSTLLNSTHPIEGVTIGNVRPELKALGSARRPDGAPLQDTDMEVKGRWGYLDKSRATMAGPGIVTVRPYSQTEREAMLAGAAALGVDEAGLFSLLGNHTVDVGINVGAAWVNVPINVWEYLLGGYQVLKKWLSYREADVLGRPLRIDEIKYFSRVVRRIAAILLLQPQLDANYVESRDHAWPWPRDPANAIPPLQSSLGLDESQDDGEDHGENRVETHEVAE